MFYFFFLVNIIGTNVKTICPKIEVKLVDFDGLTL